MTTVDEGAVAAGEPARVDEACVRFDGFQLGPLSLALEAGSIVCVVGPNGAGKTTLLRALAGLVPLSSGRIVVGGREVAGRDESVRRCVGWVPDDGDELLPELTASELWALHAHAHARWGGDPRQMEEQARALARRLDFDPPPRLVATFSHGMRKKTQLVAGLLHRPDVVLVDEPRNGLDPIAIERLEWLLRELRDDGRSVVVATHDLWYAERTGDRVAVLRHGRLAACGPPGELMAGSEASFSEAFFRLITQEPARGG